MAENSAIEWCDHTASPWHGCSKVSPGCDNCYAAAFAPRNPAILGVWGDDGVRVRSKSFVANLRRWQNRAQKSGTTVTVFPSLCDPFEDRPEIEPWRREMFSVADECQNVILMLLTKRPNNIRPMWPLVSGAADFIGGEVCTMSAYRPNVWIGASVEDQPRTKRIGNLLACRYLSPVLFLSCEPLLGPLRLNLLCEMCCWKDDGTPVPEDDHPLCGHGRVCPFIDWVIIGCESDGPRVGRMGEFASESAWWDGASRIVDQCQTAGVAVFVKQGPRNGRVVHDLDDFPAPCRVRQFPVSEVRA